MEVICLSWSHECIVAFTRVIPRLQRTHIEIFNIGTIKSAEINTGININVCTYVYEIERVVRKSFLNCDYEFSQFVKHLHPCTGTYRFRWISRRTAYSILVFILTSSPAAYSTYMKVIRFVHVITEKKEIGTSKHTFSKKSPFRLHSAKKWIEQFRSSSNFALFQILNFRDPELPFDEFFFNLMFIFGTSPHWLFHVVILPSSKGLAEYLTMWTEFEVRQEPEEQFRVRFKSPANEFQKHFFLVTGSTIKLDFRMKFIKILIFGTFMATIVPVAQTFILGSFTLLESVGFYHPLAIYTFLYVWWCLQCNAFIFSVRSLRKVMRKVRIKRYCIR